LLLGWKIGVLDGDGDVGKSTGESLHSGGQEARAMRIGETIVQECNLALGFERMRKYFR
jgi:hypothetical protein